MVAYTMVHMSSEQGKSVIWPHITELPVKIYITSKLEFSLVAKSWGGAKRHPRPPNFMVTGATAPAAPPVPTPMVDFAVSKERTWRSLNFGQLHVELLDEM